MAAFFRPSVTICNRLDAMRVRRPCSGMRNGGHPAVTAVATIYGDGYRSAWVAEAAVAFSLSVSSWMSAPMARSASAYLRPW